MTSVFLAVPTHPSPADIALAECDPDENLAAIAPSTFADIDAEIGRMAGTKPATGAGLMMMRNMAPMMTQTYGIGVQHERLRMADYLVQSGRTAWAAGNMEGAALLRAIAGDLLKSLAGPDGKLGDV